MDQNTIWKNIYGQIHFWWQGVGIFVVIAVGLYIAGNADWTMRGLVGVVAGAIAAALSRQDHKKTQEVAGDKKPDQNTGE